MPDIMPDLSFTTPDFNSFDVERAIAYRYGADRVDASGIHDPEVRSLKSGRSLSSFVYTDKYRFEFTVKADPVEDGYLLTYTNIRRFRNRNRS